MNRCGQHTPLIVNLAPVGCVIGKSDTPHIPISPTEIIDDVAACMELGLQIVHLHAREADGSASNDPEKVGRLVEAVRALPGGREVVVCVSTSGRHDPSFESRARVLDLTDDMKPDMASLTLSSLNFMQSASINTPDTIRQLAARMRVRGIQPELEIFDLGMVNMARVLIKEGLITGPVYANVLLGSIASAQASLLHVAALLGSMPDDWTVALAGIGQAQCDAHLLGMLYANGVRVGLEDAIWMDRHKQHLATNLDLVKRVRDMAEMTGREIMPRGEVRRVLGLEGNSNVARSKAFGS